MDKYINSFNLKGSRKNKELGSFKEEKKIFAKQESSLRKYKVSFKRDKKVLCKRLICTSGQIVLHSNFGKFKAQKKSISFEYIQRTAKSILEVEFEESSSVISSSPKTTRSNTKKQISFYQPKEIKQIENLEAKDD